jgi:hypothetical protein
MKVRAIKECYYDNKRRKKGSIFELKEFKGLKLNAERKLVPHVFSVKEQFSASCMECLDDRAKAELVEEPKREARGRKPKTLAQAAKTDRVIVSDLEVI